ncbi:MAG: cytochrome c oxidase subunit 3 [Armatimonadota bacterium]
MSLKSMEDAAVAGSGHHMIEQKLSFQFEDLDQQNETYIVGMWSFLVTEVMFLGALFLAYTLYRVMYFNTYLEAHHFLDVKLGTLNTLVLLSSSLSAALAVNYAQHGQRIKVAILLAFTCLCAFGFMGIKYVEYTSKINEGLLPDQNFNYAKALTVFHEHHKPAAGAEENPRANVAWEQLELARKANQVSFVVPKDNPETTFVESGFDNRVTSAADATARVVVKSPARERFDIEAGKAKIFFSIYFCMTGLHGIHVIIGIICMTTLILMYLTKHPAVDDYMPTEMVGLYWHFVDIVWIFLFPLMYLIS